MGISVGSAEAHERRPWKRRAISPRRIRFFCGYPSAKSSGASPKIRRFSAKQVKTGKKQVETPKQVRKHPETGEFP